MSASEILAVFDILSESFEFPGFNNANYATADARMHLFRGSDSGWALLIEELVDWPGANGPETILFGAGPLLAGGGSGLVTPFESLLTTESDDDGLVSARVRGILVDLEPVNSRAEVLEVEPAFALLVHLSETQRDELFHRSNELGAHLAPDARHLLTIADWCHPNVYHGDKPSTSEAFQQVAEVLATGAPSAWGPTKVSNNRNWRMWLDTL